MCRAMGGWTDEVYQDQPGYLIDWYFAFIGLEGQVRREKS